MRLERVTTKSAGCGVRGVVTDEALPQANRLDHAISAVVANDKTIKPAHKLREVWP